MSDEARRQQTFEVWNKIASLYEERFMELPIYNESYDTLCTLAPAQARVLELACGPGNITRYLLRQRPDLRIRGIDMAPNMIRLARKHNPSATFTTGDIRDIGKLQDHYDVIVCGFGLPYLSSSEADDLFVHSAALIETEGLLYISFVDGAPEQSGIQTSSSGDQLYFYYHDQEHIRQQLTHTGWTVICHKEVPYIYTDGTGSVHTIFICTYTQRNAGK